jgi:hypothetical protein
LTKIYLLHENHIIHVYKLKAVFDLKYKTIMRRRFFDKIGGDLPTDNFMVFDKSVSDPANITISEDSDFLYRLITSGFYRVLCKSAAGGREVFVCRLGNNDSNLYLDGSRAVLTGQEGDVMVVFLEFWYKWYKVDDNRFLYHFADHNIDGTYIHVPQSLVGAYKGYVSLNRLYSWSDVTPTTNVSLSDFRSYAKARGTGYQVIDFQQHCVIAMMLYAKYKTRNTQAVLGTGGAISDPATTTGSSNEIGNVDTKNENSKYVSGLGLEGVFGGIFEWVDGVEINNRVWKITDPDGSTRNVNAATSDGWITNIAAENGPFFDMVPTNVGGSETTHYSDHYDQSSDVNLVLARSAYDSYSYDGVAFVDAFYDASSMYPYYGSRLAFRGTISEVSPEQFKKLPAL